MIPNVSETRAARLLSLYEAAEREILRKLAKRFAGVPDTARIPAWIARKHAEVLKAVQEITAVLTELEAASREMRTAMLESAYQMGSESFNEELPKQGADGLFSSLDINLAPEGAQALAPLMDEIDGRFSELHRRILRESEDEYRKIIADVLPNAALGVDSVREATRAALNAFADKGIAGFTDRAGRFWGMAEYAEMAVRTGLKLAHIAGFTQNALAKGYDLVIISDHADTCPICSKWERKVLSLTGMQADDPECDGWLADAQREGLFHPNCQHDMAVYVPGQTDRRAGHDISAEGRRKDEQGYNNRQKQRYYERMVRRWKRRQAAALTPEDEREARGHVAQWQKKLRTLTTEAHLRRKYEREGGRVTLSDEAKRLKPLQIGESGSIIKRTLEVEETAPSSTKESVADVHFLCKIDKDIYSCVTQDIATDEVVLTNERIQHIKDRHPEDYERYFIYIKRILQEPDYILEDAPNTALILKEFKEDDRMFRLVLRLKTSSDPHQFMNSVLTFMKTNPKKWQQNIRNKKILYKRDE